MGDFLRREREKNFVLKLDTPSTPVNTQSGRDYTKHKLKNKFVFIILEDIIIRNHKLKQ